LVARGAHARLLRRRPRARVRDRDRAGARGVGRDRRAQADRAARSRARAAGGQAVDAQLDADGEELRAVRERGRHLRRAARVPEARTRLREAPYRRGRARAKALYALRRWRECIAAMRKLLASSPHDADLHAYIAYALDELHEYKDALADVESALGIDPDN